MKQYIHRGDITFAMLLAFFLTWYNVLGVAQHGMLTGRNILRLVVSYITVAVLLEVVFALVYYLRKKPLFGNAKSLYFSWARTLPVSLIISACSSLFYYIYLPSPIQGLTLLLIAAGFVVSLVLTMLYLYSLVEKK